ncbi:hypothetical protein SAMN05216227_101142 [Pseudorhodobacter antarcticus]|uniref:Uncharacterized protein n=1 Tax=Pseudorhodobacter antarcticus TaxID=1077947 RepID=A0A1H8FMB4_9RHOB|nr:hypothetical protein [Pseudorhodobacter antarcticus]SEN32327.1 hypothetical protein SAMN05216227_101142 [Pseudorhodobacter antarcticus]
MSYLTLLADILFVGHSLVGPSLPAMVEGGARLQGQEMSVAAQVINGAPLRFAWDNSADGEQGDARVILPQGDTKVLVLTEAVPVANQIEWNDSAGYVAKFAGLAWESRPDTQVYIYETWPSIKSSPGVVIEGDAGAGVPWRERLTADLPLWEGMTATANAARPDGAPLVRLIPAGQAMGRLADAIAAGQVPGITTLQALYDDDIHPSHQTLYFLALVHLSVITGKDPAGLPPKLTRQWLSRAGVISDAQAAVFQRIAWDAVTTYRADDTPRIEALAAAAPAAPVQTPAPAAAATPAAIAQPEPAIAAAPAITPPSTADLPRAITNPKLALGLSGVVDWSVQQPFLDVMKTARPWVGQLPGQWGGIEYETLRDGGYLDPNGWPTSLPLEATGITTLFLTDLPADAGMVAGRYVLRYAGAGAMKLEGRAQIVDGGPGLIVFDYTPGSGSVSLTITAVDAANPIREISVVRDDRLAAHDAGAMFNPDWLARIRGTKGLRFMDWMDTNNSTLARLQDRPKPADFSWAIKGVPVEVMVALANDLRADAWFTLPHLADDALVRAYAEVVRDRLAAGLRAQVEYSNEMWNWQFTQATWADEQCRARWDASDCWVQFYALRAAEVADIWAEVFGPADADRLVRVIATQTGWQGLEEQIFDAPLAVAEGRKPPVDSFDAYAVTGYFAAGLGSDDKAAVLQGWLRDSRQMAVSQADQQSLTGPARDAYIAQHRFDMATDRAATELENGFVTGQTADTLVSLLTSVLPYHAGIAAARGLDLVMYEGGTHVVATASLLNDDDVTAFFHHLNYSPQMGVLYDRLIEGWAALTPEPFNAFVDIYSPNKWGSWGGLRHLGDDNPRWQSLAHGCKSC